MSVHSVITSLPPMAPRRALTPSETSLLETFRTRAAWIWTVEDSSLREGTSPALEQRAFRKTFTYSSSSKGAPSNATIMVAVDDYFAMYVNGIPIQLADPNHDYQTVLAYNVPLPLVEGSQDTSMVLAFRVVQKAETFAGLIAAVQVNYPNAPSSPDVFYTGSDQSWLGERNFQEHWEQPWFETAAQQSSSSWRPAQVWPSSIQDRNRHTMKREEVIQFERFPALPQPAPTPIGCDPVVGCSGKGATEARGIGISAGAFAGTLVGAVALALVLGALGCYVVLRRHDRVVGARGKEVFYEGVVVEPRTAAGRQVHIQ